MDNGEIKMPRHSYALSDDDKTGQDDNLDKCFR